MKNLEFLYTLWLSLLIIGFFLLFPRVVMYTVGAIITILIFMFFTN